MPKIPYIVMRFNDDGINYLNVNGKWSEKLHPGYSANHTRFWNNSGNAWNAIAKLVKNKKEKFEELFVMGQNELVTPHKDHAVSIACILDYTRDSAELDTIIEDIIKEKSEQIELLEETLTELRVATYHNSEDD
jgi:hypothetical protein